MEHATNKTKQDGAASELSAVLGGYPTEAFCQPFYYEVHLGHGHAAPHSDILRQPLLWMPVLTQR